MLEYEDTLPTQIIEVTECNNTIDVAMKTYGHLHEHRLLSSLNIACLTVMLVLILGDCGARNPNCRTPSLGLLCTYNCLQ